MLWSSILIAAINDYSNPLQYVSFQLSDKLKLDEINMKEWNKYERD